MPYAVLLCCRCGCKQTKTWWDATPATSGCTHTVTLRLLKFSKLTHRSSSITVQPAEKRSLQSTGWQSSERQKMMCAGHSRASRAAPTTCLRQRFTSERTMQDSPACKACVATQSMHLQSAACPACQAAISGDFVHTARLPPQAVCYIA